MKLLFSLLLLLNLLNAKYLDNHSCEECHEKIYEEFQSSAHARGFFNDELHRAIATKINSKKYNCAVCHMPQANNIKKVIAGKSKLNKRNKTHTDAVGCFFCHTIAYVKKAHKFNVIQKAKQAKDYKPTLYGRLDDPEDSDKHSSLESPIYAKMACAGCHSHKVNDYNVTIFRAMDEKQDSQECIKCHMPEAHGGAEKLDKKFRNKHVSHKFLGIRDKEFRKKGLDINITFQESSIDINITNKMAHPLIIQPARAKYLEIKIKRDKKIIWSNYKKNPSEDKKGYFAYSFKKDGKKIIIPNKATSGSSNNIKAKSSKILTYTTPKLQKGDIVELKYWAVLAKKDCAKVVKLKDKSFLKPMLINAIIQKY